MKIVGLWIIGFAVFILSSPAVASKPEADSNIPHNAIQLPRYLDHAEDIDIDIQPICYDSVSLDSFIRIYMETQHIPGVAIWCFKNGQIIWQQCFGYANLGDSKGIL